jgi:hypothetical protein
VKHEKPLLLAGLIAVSLLMNVCSAKANIGDTLTQSNARYGEPWRQQGNLYYYLTGGYLIAELVSPSTGAVEYIEYTKGQGAIDHNELDRIMKENFPAYYLDSEHWRMQADHRGQNSRDNAKLNVSVDNRYSLETGWDIQAGDGMNSYLSISTPVGWHEMMPLKIQADANRGNKQ